MILRLKNNSPQRRRDAKSVYLKYAVTVVAQSLILVLIGALVSCKTGPDKTAERVTQEDKPQVHVPQFNSDSAYLFVKQQVDFGPRVPNSVPHKKCAAYLEQKLRSFGAKVIVQEGMVKLYNGNFLKIQNIIASFNPDTANRILLLAHWDSRPFADHDPDPANHKKPIDGANDGASGVGVLLEVARQLGISSPGIGIDILLVDAEDYGPPQDQMQGEDTSDWWGLGTQFWAKQPHVTGYSARYGILLDMVGASNATFLMEGISMTFASHIVKKVWTTGSNLGYSDYFIFEQGNPVTDDHLFINRILNLPTIDIIHLDRNSKNGFFPYWHTVKDNIDVIDKNTLKAVGQTLLTVIYREQ